VRSPRRTHAIYGTDGFAAPLVPVEARPEVRQAIGEESEQTVYFYSSCDRDLVYPQLGGSDPVLWVDRFTGEQINPVPEQLEDFMELTWANALDVVGDRRDADWSDLRAFLRQTQGLVSEPARAAADNMLGLAADAET
jgi:hypothetical protein